MFESTKVRFNKVIGFLQSNKGSNVTEDEAMNVLLDCFERIEVKQ